RRDPALIENAIGLHTSILGNGKEHVEDLCGQHVVGWVEKQRMDVGLARFQVLLQLGSGGANVVGSFEGVHPLVERSRRCGPGHLEWGGHAGGEYSRGPPRCKAIHAISAKFTSTSSRGSAIERRQAVASSPLSAMAISPATRPPASGSRKLSVPTATRVAPA